jgi:hypothetical protein
MRIPPLPPGEVGPQGPGEGCVPAVLQHQPADSPQSRPKFQLPKPGFAVVTGRESFKLNPHLPSHAGEFDVAHHTQGHGNASNRGGFLSQHATTDLWAP